MKLVYSKSLLTVALSSIGSLGIFGFAKPIDEYKIMVNYNGQADVLLSLQIPPDYYPYQFKKTRIYDYLTNIDRYIVANDKVTEGKKNIKKKLQKKIDYLFSHIKEFGPSLWNADLYDTGIVFRNDQFWNSKKTSLLFLEQFVADDYVDIRDSYNLLPIHKNLIITNYRAARDPYTIFSDEIFKCFDDKKCNDIGKKFRKYMDEYNLQDINSIYRFGKYILFWNRLSKINELQKGKINIKELIRDKKLFSLDDNVDKILANKYKKVIFSEEELEELNRWEKDWKMNYERSFSPKLAHHPALEQQIIPGTAPLAEGSQKDIIVFLYQFASLIQEYSESDSFKREFKDDYRKNKMKSAISNAKKIADDTKTRILNIRDYFKKIQVVDQSFNPELNNYTTTNSKTFSVVTYPPASFGAGEATIQSMSKFPFIYHDIGLKQPIPRNLNNLDVTIENDIFSVDDNGWWWKIGNASLDPKHLLEFSKTSDTLLLLANEDDWNLLKDKSSSTLSAIGTLLNQDNFRIDLKKINSDGYPVNYNKYHLWNEGLRSPIALNLLLDNLVDIFQKQYDKNLSQNSEYSKAMEWGNYWNNDFLEIN